MARRKNTKRIDPRYFLNETTYKVLNEEALTPHLLGQGDTSRPLNSLQNYMLGDIDLADMVRGMHDEMFDMSIDMSSAAGGSGVGTPDVIKAYLQKNPDRKVAFDTLLQAVQLYDKAIEAQANGQDISQFEKQLMPMIPKLKKLGIRAVRKADSTMKKGYDQISARDRQKQTDARRAAERGKY